jgi:transposase
VEHLAETQYPEVTLLRKVPGVGPVTALTFVLTIGDAKRFARSRDVGCYLGLRPRQQQSGERDPQLGITKAGNRYLRTLLVECAQHVLGVFGADTALRRWGLSLAERGGKNAKKRAIVAVARKLAVLLHRLWVTQEPYEPFYGVPAATV